jgi:hypothetical protein
LEDKVLKEVGYETLNRIEVLALQDVPIPRIAAITRLPEETVEYVLCGPEEE